MLETYSRLPSTMPGAVKSRALGGIGSVRSLAVIQLNCAGVHILSAFMLTA